MSREVRMVLKNWQHPTDENNRYIPLYDDYEGKLERFRNDIEEKGLSEAIDYWGGGPQSEDYMLAGIPTSQRTYYMMYESVSDGTPISPAFETPEKLAQWLVKNNASSFGSKTATYSQWLRVCKGGYVPSMIYRPETGIVSGLEDIFDE